MKILKLLNSLFFQLSLTLIFSVQLVAVEPVDIWKDNSEIKIESTESNQINIEDEETTLFDHSGNSNHGTIEGATWYMEGCTNPLADNYNHNATVDDGSCEGEYVDRDDYFLNFYD